MPNAIEFLKASKRLEERLGESIETVELLGDSFPSNRGTVNVYEINGREHVVVKEQSDLKFLEAERVGYNAFNGVPGILELIDYTPGLLIIPFVETAETLDIGSMNAQDIAQIVDFLVSSFNVEQRRSAEDYQAAVDTGYYRLTTQFRSLHNLAHYMEDIDSTIARFEELKEATRDLSVVVHRVHGDLFPNNILRQRGNLYFVDLEFSDIGDTATDLARFYRAVFQHILETGNTDQAMSIVTQMSGDYANRTGDHSVNERLQYWIPKRMLNGGNHFENVRREMGSFLSGVSDLDTKSYVHYFRQNKERIVMAAKMIGRYYRESEVSDVVDQIVDGNLDAVETYKDQIKLRLDKATELAAFNARTSELILRAPDFNDGLFYSIEGMLPLVRQPYLH